MSFLLPRALYVEYLSGGPSVSLRTLEVDLADGKGYRPISWDQRMTVSYSTAGAKRIKIRFTYRGASRLSSPVSYESQFDLYVPVAAALASSNNGARPNNLASLANDSVTFAAAPGQTAGKAYIRYADSR